MSLLDSILGQVADNTTIQNLAAKVGLSPEQVEQAVAALGQAHAQEGDTVQTASEATGLPADKLNEIVQQIGGKGSLGRFASLLEGEGGFTGAPQNFFSCSGLRRAPGRGGSAREIAEVLLSPSWNPATGTRGRQASSSCAFADPFEPGAASRPIHFSMQEAVCGMFSHCGGGQA